MKNWSLRTRITLWSVLITALALGTFGAVVAYVLYSEGVEAIDTQLETDARFALGGLKEDGKAVAFSWIAKISKGDSDFRGFVAGRSKADEPERAVPEDLRSAIRSWPPPRRHFSRRVGHDNLRFGVFSGEGQTFVLAASLEAAEESVEDLLGAYLIALPAVLLIVAAGSWWIARRALEPIAGMTEAAAQITAERLDARLTPPRARDEIGRLTEVLNGMFDRLQRSFEQANRFTADAAHELRTPLTIMRGQIEEALRAGSLEPAQQRLLAGLLEENSGLQKISDNLLLLAKFDAGRRVLSFAPVDLSALVGEVQEDAEMLAVAREIRVHAAIVPGLSVRGDEVMLRRVALNLVDNAVKFNRPGGEVRIVLERGKDEVLFSVANTGPGIPIERQAALFQRFYRSDEGGRNREQGGSGLGLSLCREIVTAHGGTIALRRAEADLTEFTVRLPVATE
jgi:signal transduction histidine kinase